MAYDGKNLSVLAYGNGFTLWHYKTSDTAATVDTAGYFNAAADMLRAGDFVLANVGQGGSPQHGLFVVLSNAAGVVNCGDMTQFGGTNTD